MRKDKPDTKENILAKINLVNTSLKHSSKLLKKNPNNMAAKQMIDTDKNYLVELKNSLSKI